MKNPAPLIATVLLMLSPPLASAPSWTMVETARDTGHLLAPVAPAPASPATAPAITLDPTGQFQEIIGFGGALTESSAWVLAQLSPEKRLEVIRRYYDPQEGIGYTLARTHLNCC